MAFSVSVVIRNRNEGEHLRRLLERMKIWRTQPLEVVVVDNASTDDSRKIIEDMGARLVHLPEGQFTYGRATNLGFEHARGELVLMLSSHTVPLGRYFLEEVTEPFADPRVAAVRIPIAANTAELLKLGQIAPLDQSSAVKDVFARGPVASGSVIRRSVWLEHKVDEKLLAAEDKEWAMRVLATGKWIMPVVPAAYAYTKRFVGDAYLNKIRKEERAGFEIAGLRTPHSFVDLVKSVLVMPRDSWRQAREKIALHRFRAGLK
ncbi:MAG: glycosyltransferase family A protein [Bryobacteraceae bacterium]